MNSSSSNCTVIDFAELRKLEKQRLKKERLAKQKQVKGNNDKIIAKSQHNDVPVDDVHNSLNAHTTTSTTSSTPTNANINPPCCLSTIEGVDTFEIKSRVQDVYYIPLCLTEEFIECMYTWLQSIQSLENQRIDEKECNGKWTRLKYAKRNVALFDLRLTKQQQHENITKMDTTLLHRLCDFLVRINAFPKSHRPNHVLINEYEPMEGIMPHTDGPLYHHRTATFSIGSDVLFQFTQRQKNHDNDEEKDALEPDYDDMVLQIMLSGKGSLVIFGGDAYINHCHSINDRIGEEAVEYASEKCVNLKQGTAVSRGHRYSLTFRHKL
jgi:alkylated DNA repair protein alkB family protein 6